MIDFSYFHYIYILVTHLNSSNLDYFIMKKIWFIRIREEQNIVCFITFRVIFIKHIHFKISIITMFNTFLNSPPKPIVEVTIFEDFCVTYEDPSLLMNQLL